MNGVSTLRLVIVLAICWPALAADTSLDALRLSLIGMRGKPPDYGGPRRATPQLTVAKHQLRDWVESRLLAFLELGDEGDLERKLNAELREAKLSCGYDVPDQQPCPDWTLLGYVDPLKFRRSGVFLILQTGVGIECGFDESAYIYGWSVEGWRRVWQTEQNDYTKEAYKPQTLHSVLISPHNKAKDYVVFTLGRQPWCQSNWHDVYYRVFRLGPDPAVPPLVDGTEMAFVPSIHGSVTANDVLVELTVAGGFDAGMYTEVRHYSIDENGASRVAPFALSPLDFVYEWLAHEWRETAFWSEDDNRSSILDWHSKLHKDHPRGEQIYPTMHCPATPDLWQVGVDFSDPPTPLDAPPKGAYFLVRWRPPYQFTMVQVSDRPSPGCTEQDRQADEYRTLFPPEK
jgi:hypothetical protein